MALHQHEFGFINVIEYGVKHSKLKKSKVQLMLAIPKKMLRRLMLEGLVGHLQKIYKIMSYPFQSIFFSFVICFFLFWVSFFPDTLAEIIAFVLNVNFGIGICSISIFCLGDFLMKFCMYQLQLICLNSN